MRGEYREVHVTEGRFVCVNFPKHFLFDIQHSPWTLGLTHLQSVTGYFGWLFTTFSSVLAAHLLLVLTLDGQAMYR